MFHANIRLAVVGWSSVVTDHSHRTFGIVLDMFQNFFQAFPGSWIELGQFFLFYFAWGQHKYVYQAIPRPTVFAVILVGSAQAPHSCRKSRLGSGYGSLHFGPLTVLSQASDQLWSCSPKLLLLCDNPGMCFRLFLDMLLLGRDPNLFGYRGGLGGPCQSAQ